MRFCKTVLKCNTLSERPGRMILEARRAYRELTGESPRRSESPSTSASTEKALLSLGGDIMVSQVSEKKRSTDVRPEDVVRSSCKDCFLGRRHAFSVHACFKTRCSLSRKTIPHETNTSQTHKKWCSLLHFSSAAQGSAGLNEPSCVV